MGTQDLRLRQGGKSAELRQRCAVENGVRGGMLYLPREILERLDAPCLEGDSRPYQHEHLQLCDDFYILDDQDLIHFRSSQDEAPLPEVPPQSVMENRIEVTEPVGHLL